MFCPKCGKLTIEGAEFCSKCGSKLTIDNTLQNSVEGIGFKSFVDNHVQATTKYKSADDLLKNSKPLRYIWVCFGLSALVGIAAGPLGVFVLGAFLGYVSAYLFGRLLYFRIYQKESTGRYKEDIDLEDLIMFLNKNLHHLSSYFGEWEYCSQNIAGEESIGCRFSKNIHAIISFSENSVSGKFYAISARKGNAVYYVTISPQGIGASKTDAGFGRLSCLYKAAPILKAAMEFYIKSNNASKED